MEENNTSEIIIDSKIELQYTNIPIINYNSVLVKYRRNIYFMIDNDKILIVV